LNDHVGYLGIESGRLDLELHDEPFAESHLLELEIGFHEFQLVPKGDLVIGGAGERDAQQLTQADQHFPGGFHVPGHQRRNAVQCIKEKMGVKLKLENLELVLGHLSFELGLSALALAKLPVVLDRKYRGYHAPIHPELLE